MNRRSFLSAAGAAPLLRMSLWRTGSASPAPSPWGPPSIRSIRGEYKRALVSFQPVEGAASYLVRWRASDGKSETIEGVVATEYVIHGLENCASYNVSVAASGPTGVTAFSAEAAVTPTPEMDWRSLAAAFGGSNPTRSSCPFWMVHGDETDAELRQFLDVAYRFGFEGVTLHPYDYKDFLGEGEWSRWKVIVEHARKLGLAVWQQDDKNYPSGYAAGTIVSRDRTLARWEIAVVHKQEFHGPASLDMRMEALVPKTHTLVSVSALGPGERIEDLTEQAAAGEIHWQVPAGRWTVCVTAAWQPEFQGEAEARGYIDPLSERATDLYVDAISGATFRHLGEEFGRTWKGFFIDEPGFYSGGEKLGEGNGSYPYTPDFLDRFAKNYGYSLRPLLPLLWVSHGKQTARVRRDYMDFVSGEYARLFIGKLTTFAESHGIQITGHVREDKPYELGAGTGDNVCCLEHYSMGGFDHIFDQWYGPDDDVYWRQPKMASSVSHYKQTPQDEAMVEHFAATGWRTGLTEMKAMMDWTTCRGLNRIVPCGLDTAQTTVWEDAPEFWLHGENPLAPYFRAYQTVANRETMMIRGGRHVAKALVLDPAESAWAGPVEDLWKVNKALGQAHFDHDIVSYRVFTDSARCRFEGRRILLGQEDYEFVVVPGVEAMPAAVLERLLSFYSGGGTVISIGPEARLEPSTMKIVARLPSRSTDGREDERVRELADKIWGRAAAGEGRAFLTGYNGVANLLYGLNAHDVWIEPNLTGLQYYHRRLSKRDLYFFNNEGEAVRTVVRLAGAVGVPEIWDPVTGRIFQAPCYQKIGNKLHVHLELARYESVFVVVNPEARTQNHLLTTDADRVLRRENGGIELRHYGSGPVHYRMESGGERTWTPGEAREPLVIASGWKRVVGERGAATYSVTFPSSGLGAAAELHVNGMTQVIHPKVNGHDLGVRFTWPFRFDLGANLLPSVNQLEIEHVERHTYESKQGVVTIVPYSALEI
jgi:hypothetical protein